LLDFLKCSFCMFSDVLVAVIILLSFTCFRIILPVSNNTTNLIRSALTYIKYMYLCGMGWHHDQVESSNPGTLSLHLFTTLLISFIIILQLLSTKILCKCCWMEGYLIFKWLEIVWTFCFGVHMFITNI
jgi:hypothetical protein